MSGMTVSEQYNCGHDCHWGAGCPGHGAQMGFAGSSETYTIVYAEREPITLTRPQMEVLLKMARQVDHERADAAPYVPDGWVLVPLQPTIQMIDAYVSAGGRFHSARSDWAIMVANRPEVP